MAQKWLSVNSDLIEGIPPDGIEARRESKSFFSLGALVQLYNISKILEVQARKTGTRVFTCDSDGMFKSTPSNDPSNHEGSHYFRNKYQKNGSPARGLVR